MSKRPLKRPMPRHATLSHSNLALKLLMFALSVSMLGPHSALAQVGPRALPALLSTPRLSRPERLRFAIAGAAGYGLREALTKGDDLHHTGFAGLGAAVEAPWGLSAELRVDGRLEKHTARGDAGTGMVGEPRAYLRYAHALGTRVLLGGELAIWVPGAHAPSLRFDATTLDALVVLDARVAPAWSLLFAPGFRLDRSAHAWPRHPESLSTGDFISLGLSAAHALLLRAGLSRELRRGRLFAEWTWDARVGKHAGALSTSTMQLALGGQAALDRDARLHLTLSARALVSQRPEVRPDRPLVPFPPRAELWCGLHYQLGKQPPTKVSVPSQALVVASEPVAAPEVDLPTAEAPPELVPSAPLPSGQLRFLVRDHRTGEPLPAEISVRLASEPRAKSNASRPDAVGRLLLDLPPGRYVVTVQLQGYRKQTKQVEVEDESVTILDLALHARSKP